MTIYVVTSGQYSDYGIDAVFLDKRKAAIYLAAHEDYEDYFSDTLRIEEWETQDDTIAVAPEKSINWKYCFSRNLRGEFVVSACHTTLESETKINRNGYGIIVGISVCLPEKDEAKAQKIMQDTLAKIKAEEEGLT